jgi:hypothetical protein
VSGFINSDGSEATKDMGQLAVESDGSAQGVKAISLKEGLGRRANRLGAGAHINSGVTGVALVNSGFTTVATLALFGVAIRQHLVAVSLLALGGTAGTDFTIFNLTWSMDDGSHTHTVYLPVGGYANLVLDGGAFCSIQNGQFVVSARANNAAGQTAFAGLVAMNLPNV